MNIGLVRHFKVDCYTKMFMTSDDFNKWIKQYDDSDVIENKFEIGNIKWHKCFSSDLSRAIKTSKAIFRSEITRTPLLREVPIAPICKTNIKLPYVFWCVSGRLGWLFNHKSQIETKKDTIRRVNEFLDSIENEGDRNILIVCHGFFMNMLQKELKRRGFVGENVRKPKNGRLYLYKK
ncbi:phosphoglycerate mutase family protein [Clostridium cibarium]|uniref:Phosphoglycerate mutase family protein n=2 Tax=Clostridium TaxID=1485 RepID=A0ABR8PTY3_9CLOT|nr:MULTISPECIES: phosphoglycerate mutase family protein [Clostridium]MBD7911637.1 phosphoglycerate mutase family protein [Clostridium cibarium]